MTLPPMRSPPKTFRPTRSKALTSSTRRRRMHLIRAVASERASRRRPRRRSRAAPRDARLSGSRSARRRSLRPSSPRPKPGTSFSASRGARSRPGSSSTARCATKARSPRAVKALFDEEKLPKTDVHIGLSSNRIGVRTLDIDVVEDESHFDNAVRFKAHEVLPVALSESVLDYRVLEERVGEDGQATRRVLLVVAPRDQVEPYQRVATQAGIKLTAIDLEALGLLRAFVEPGTGVADARRHRDRRDRNRPRVVHPARLRWRRLRVHAGLRLGRRRAGGRDR